MTLFRKKSNFQFSSQKIKIDWILKSPLNHHNFSLGVTTIIRRQFIRTFFLHLFKDDTSIKKATWRGIKFMISYQNQLINLLKLYRLEKNQ